MTVVGLGIEGIDLVCHLASEGATVTVSDARPREQLGDQLAAIAEVIERGAVTLSLGANRVADAVAADYVFASQGVPAELPALRAAREAGVPVSSMTQLFLERCPAPVSGITGSAGKTTTTALVGAMLDAAGVDHVVGGNIGVGLLSLLPLVRPDTRVVIELSHTQLASVDRSPHLACVTNVTPNHLDRFSWDEYVGLKRRIFAFQGADDTAVFNLDDEVCAGFAAQAPGRVLGTARLRDIPGDGALLRGDAVVARRHGEERALLRRDEIPLRGDHNVENVLSAVAVAGELAIAEAAIAAGVRGFRGVPHRLEHVATVAGVTYVNDSIATTPERTLAGMRSYEGPLVLLLGGRHKDLPLGALAAEAARRCRAVITFGEHGPLFADAVRARAAGGTPAVLEVGTVAEAVRAAADAARDGDVVLFAPAGTSFDAFRNFEARGQAFRDAVAALERR
ncbi:MAG: UDP-N-acetylmuramoyl-L-alanine--D-glutamate ligase [Dehalococcoidia bacterium]